MKVVAGSSDAGTLKRVAGRLTTGAPSSVSSRPSPPNRRPPRGIPSWYRPQKTRALWCANTHPRNSLNSGLVHLYVKNRGLARLVVVQGRFERRLITGGTYCHNHKCWPLPCDFQDITVPSTAIGVGSSRSKTVRSGSSPSRCIPTNSTAPHRPSPCKVNSMPAPPPRTSST